MTDQQFEILIVCHANICRSPMAERLARKSVAQRMGEYAAGFRVVSAGTHAWSNAAIHPFAAEVLSEHGADPTGFLSRRLTEALVRRAGLILTATRRQRSDCVALDPSAVRRTFTLLQLGRYAAHGIDFRDAQQVFSGIGAMLLPRTFLPPPPPAADRGTPMPATPPGQ